MRFELNIIWKVPEYFFKNPLGQDNFEEFHIGGNVIYEN